MILHGFCNYATSLNTSSTGKVEVELELDEEPGEIDSGRSDGAVPDRNHISHPSRPQTPDLNLPPSSVSVESHILPSQPSFSHHHSVSTSHVDSFLATNRSRGIGATHQPTSEDNKHPITPPSQDDEVPKVSKMNGDGLSISH